MNLYLEKITQLSKVFLKNGQHLYPLTRYKDETPLRVSQKEYKNFKFHNSNYCSDIDHFLSFHDYPQSSEGADLPWWGDEYFSNKKGKRVMVISQETRSPLSGSIAFHANLMKHMDENHYNDFLDIYRLPKFTGWMMAKELFEECGIDYDFMYITDGRKVERKSLSQKKLEHDSEILKAEIEICNPDVIIILGYVGLFVLNSPQKKVTEILMQEDTSVWIEDKKGDYWKLKKRFMVAPFPSSENMMLWEKYKSKAALNIKALLQ